MWHSECHKSRKSWQRKFNIILSQVGSILTVDSRSAWLHAECLFNLIVVFATVWNIMFSKHMFCRIHCMENQYVLLSSCTSITRWLKGHHRSLRCEVWFAFHENLLGEGVLSVSFCITFFLLEWYVTLSELILSLHSSPFLV